MAGLVADLTIRLKALGLGALTETRRELGALATTADKFKKALDVGANANQFAGTMDRIKAGAFGLVQSPIEEFKTFESAMARAKSKMDEVSGQDFARMRKAAMDAGATTAFSAAQAADGLGEMAAAGFSVEQQIAALPKVLQLAQAGEVGVGEATKIAASAMAQFGLKASDVGSIGDILLKASNASTIGLGEIAESLKYVGPVASAAGLSLKSTASFVALLGNSGIEASSAGTALRGMIASMAAPSGKSKKALAELGLSTQDLAKGVKDPIAALKLLGERFEAKNYTDAQKLGVVMRVFGRETSAAVMSLIAAGSKAGENGTAFQNMARAMDNADGAMQRAADVLGDTTANKLKRLTAQVDSLKIAAGEKLAPALLDLGDRAKPWLTSLGSLIEEHPRLLGGLGNAALLVGGLALAAKGAALGWGALQTAMALPWGALVAPIRIVATQIMGLNQLLGVNQVIASTAGQTWKAGALGAAQLATQIAGVAAAAYAGYEAGKLLDGVLGSVFGARGGKLSTEAALQAGESDGFNSFVGKAGKFLGSDTLQEIAAGNTRRNADQAAAAQTGGYPNSVGQTPASVSPDLGQFNAVTGQIEVKVTDQRVQVTSRSRGAVPLRVGQTPVGVR